MRSFLVINNLQFSLFYGEIGLRKKTLSNASKSFIQKYFKPKKHDFRRSKKCQWKKIKEYFPTFPTATKSQMLQTFKIDVCIFWTLLR